MTLATLLNVKLINQAVIREEKVTPLNFSTNDIHCLILKSFHKTILIRSKQKYSEAQIKKVFDYVKKSPFAPLFYHSVLPFRLTIRMLLPF